MVRYILKRTAQILLTLFVFLSIVFFVVNAQPGDVSNIYSLNPDLPPETRERLRDMFGVNEPLWKQYLVHVRNTLTGNFGVSFIHYPRSSGGRDSRASAADADAVSDGDGGVVLPGLCPGQDNRVAQGQLDGIYLDDRGRDAVHGVHALVRADDDLAIRIQGGLVPDRQVPGSGSVAGRSD